MRENIGILRAIISKGIRARFTLRSFAIIFLTLFGSNLLSVQAAPGPYYINEIIIGTPFTDTTLEYVELRGPAGATIPAGVYLLGIEGDGSSAGIVDNVFDLSGKSFGANGFMVLRHFNSPYAVDPGASVYSGNATGGFGGLPGYSGGLSFEEGSSTFIIALSPTAPTAGTTDIDSNNDGTPDGTFYPALTIYDSIATLDGTSTADRVYSLFTISNGANGTHLSGTNRLTETFFATYMARNGNTTGSTAADFFANSDTWGSGTNPNFTLSSDLTQVYPDSRANQVFTNNLGATNVSSPTSATVSVGGRVSDASKNPVGKALISLIDAGGATRYALTNPFGYYQFDDVEVGQTYIISVISKRYQFQPQAVTVIEEIQELNFVAMP